MNNPNGEIRSLGMFHPSQLRIETIQAELKPYLPRCCQCEAIGVAAQNQTVIHPDNQQWHQDGGGTAGTTRHMVVWATETPTYLRDSSGSEFRGEPYELVWFDNDKAFHRQPVDINPATRWFVSVRCSGKVF